MYYGGIKRAEKMMADAETGGRANTNPYAKSIFDQFVLPLSEAVRSEIDNTQSNHQHAALKLLAALDTNVMAFLAVRTVVNTIMQTASGDHRRLASAIGKTIHSELVLAQIEAHNPELYHTLANDFGRKLSKDERHRMTVFKRSAKKAGVEVIEWETGSRDQVGMYLLGVMEVLGLVEIAPHRGPVKTKSGRGLKSEPRPVFLAESVTDEINESKAFTAISMPVYGPTVEPPRDWTAIDSGGFHTPELIRGHRYLIRAGSAVRERAKGVAMPIVLDAVNTLQRTAWAVNEEVLEIVHKAAAEGLGTKEIVSLESLPKPESLEWAKSIAKEDMTAEQALEFKLWKRKMAEWYTQRKLLGTKYGRFYSATRAAEMFRAYPSIWFVYFADSRGRLYPMTYGLNPQGSDLQRGLLRFSRGLPLDSPDAIRWFHVQGANKWGFDKATLEERQQWVVDRQEQILQMASDPLSHAGWREADSPIQFLAWALEYSRWYHDVSGTFISHLPISMDGSCNGLQNLSALLRDEIGGKATNLTANEQMQDIYAQVAAAATVRLRAMLTGEHAELVHRWLTHGVNRKVVKRSVMTTPYGVTRSSAEDYVVSDYLAEETNPFTKEEYRAAAKVLMQAVWPAIGDVVVKGREAMAWLKRAARVIVNSQSGEDTPLIQWESPSGFPASQAYWGREETRIVSRLHGIMNLRVHTESEEADVYKHSSGLAPNFVHSMDAAHLHRTTSTASKRGIDALAMIHDDYGTHAAKAQELFDIIREQFVAMYLEHDPIKEFKDRYPMIADPPKPGTLDITEVLRSKYFFS